MAGKTELLGLKTTKAAKEKIANDARMRDRNISQYVLDALAFYSEFDPDFLSMIKSRTKSTGQSVPVVIQRLLAAYVSTEAGILKVFKHKSKTFQRAFMVDESGLIPIEKLPKIIQHEALEDANKFRDKLMAAVEKGDPVMIQPEEAAMLAAYAA
jgi:hypothetical protein